MKRRNGLLRTCVIGALLSGLAWAVPGMQAQAGDLPLKAPAAAEPVPYWWFHGEVEVGGRAFLNDPPRNGAVYRAQNSLAKYYEYSDNRPGPFSNIWLATGSRDGLYQADFVAKNIGYNDQSYFLDLSKAGEHYLSLGWDQTPHLYSTSALTPYRGIGTTALTLPPAAVGLTPATIGPFLNQTDIGIKRDTASVSYRWTPTDAWDIKADLSHLHRTGTQVDGVVGFGNPYNPIEVPRPVDDTTQNYGLNGEYVGTSPWGKKFNFKLAYNGSQYSDDFTSYTIQNPAPSGTNTPFARLSTWPSNQMNSFSGTLGADLPWMSRYAGTVSYSMMRQNDAFIPMSYQATFTLPASSLNGSINTLMSNNVVTTKITPELTNKLTYRYYDFQNNTPELLFSPSWASLDRQTATEAAISSLSIAYTKQNAGEELTWHPSRQWTLGAAYGYERYDLTRDSVDATNEHSGKVFADWKPESWLTVRSSGYFANRRYENYNYLANVAAIQFPGRAATNGWLVNPAYRQLMTDNRDRWKANFAVDLVAIHNLTLTPTFKYQDDNYGLNRATEFGLRDSRSWSAGIDATYVLAPGTSIMVGYMREYYTQLVYNSNQTDPIPATILTETNDRSVVDTFTAMARYAVIPDKLDTELRYTASHGVDKLNLNLANGAPPSSGGQFPDMTTWYQRLDATVTYKFDEQQVAALGWKGQVKAKLHYAWERTSVSNWADDSLAPYTPLVSANELWLGFDNPNYNVHMLMASLAWSW